MNILSVCLFYCTVSPKSIRLAEYFAEKGELWPHRVVKVIMAFDKGTINTHLLLKISIKIVQ